MSSANPDTGGVRVHLKDTLWLVLLTICVRAVVVYWASRRFPPAADGQFYQVVALRISRGLGYTWLWPDGAVTYAAHYPVGYPAILGGFYRWFGPFPVWAMILNGLVAAVTTACVHRLAARTRTRAVALFAGLLAALHPTLVFYTPAMMTELVSAGLLIAAVALAFTRGSEGHVASSLRVLGIGLLIGLSTLVRPQQLLWAPLLGAWLGYRLTAGRALWRSVLGAGLATALAVGCCLPWTARNCDRMGRCIFVSANGGWNLMIGTSPLGKGAWTSIDSIGVPPECRTVFQEAEKDVCFGNAAKRWIASHQGQWLSLMPAKLAKTFDDVGAPGYYLNASNSAEFGDDAKWRLGASEVVVSRLLALLAHLGLALASGPHRRLRQGIAIAAILMTFTPFGWTGVLLYCGAVVLLGRRLFDEPELLLLGVGWGMTAVVHAVFFGGARYVIVILPLLITAAARGLEGVLEWASGPRRKGLVAGRRRA